MNKNCIQIKLGRAKFAAVLWNKNKFVKFVKLLAKMIFLLFGLACAADRFVPPFEYRGTVWPMPREIKSSSDFRLKFKFIVLKKAYPGIPFARF